MTKTNLADSRRRLELINHSPLGKTRFEDLHHRITLHLENDVYAELQLLRRPGMSQSKIVNSALKEFFKNYCLEMQT